MYKMFGISIVDDINSVLDTRNTWGGEVYVLDDKVLVAHEYRGHDIVTHFKGDGVMNIYQCCIAEFINNLDKYQKFPHVLYDTHWTMGNGVDCTRDAYCDMIKKLLGE